MHPEAHWDFVGSDGHHSNVHALVFSTFFLCFHKVSSSSLTECLDALFVPESQVISPLSRLVVEAQIRQTRSLGNVVCGDTVAQQKNASDVRRNAQRHSGYFHHLNLLKTITEWRGLLVALYGGFTPRALSGEKSGDSEVSFQSLQVVSYAHLPQVINNLR